MSKVMEHPQPEHWAQLLGGQCSHGPVHREWLDTYGIKDFGPIVLSMGPQAEKGVFDRCCSRITAGGARPNHVRTLAQPPTPLL
jgi:hypothetical protein